VNSRGIFINIICQGRLYWKKLGELNDLCAERRSYARSEKVMRGEMKLYALRNGYARRDEVMRAQNGLCAVKRGYTRSE